MADKRINALATTAPSTASDDFFAVDGTTNGTRKLNAFSPTFGGNVVVTGTLTSNSTLSTAVGLSCQNADITGGYITLRGFGSQDGGLIFLGQAANNNYINSSATAISTAIANTAVVRAQAEGWRVLTTTASTSTSSGALVVSGGVGVGGAIYAGGDLTVDKTEPTITFKRAANTNLNIINFWTGVGADFGIGLRNTSDSDLHIYNYGTSNDALKISKATSAVTLNSTTASTSTSSGALVVSGGVGVAGKVTSTALGLANTSQSAAAWGDVGVQLSVAGAVLTDTSSSGTVGRIVTNSIAASALAASSTTTYTAAASLFIAGAPTANTNVTITNAYALYTAGGRINFQGLPTSSAGLQAGTLWNDGGTLKVA